MSIRGIEPIVNGNRDQLGQTWALFDDNLAGGQHLWLSAPLRKLQCHRADQVKATFREIERARAAGHWVAIAAAYELGYALEPRLSPLLTDVDTPLLSAWIFTRGERIAHDEGLNRIDGLLAHLDEHQQRAGVASLTLGMEREDYIVAVERIRRLIHAGDCYQVNFTWPITGTLYGSPLALYRRLIDAQPVRHGAFITDPAGTLLSRSPELFVARNGQRLSCRPMKGTASRSSNPERLAQSAKDRAENVMIVDLIRNDLGRLAPAGGVKVDALCDIEAYPSVWQMTSSVSAEPVDADLYSIFRALFPCGSVTGAPKIRAMEIINELEAAPRGVYCGAIGWMAPCGDFSFNVPIRTLDAQPDGRFRMSLGSGIVADSEGASEWAECLLKGRFLTSLRAPFNLIETLCCEAGTPSPYPRLEGHLNRLARSARHFGHAIKPEAIRQALLDTATALASDTKFRVRLELSPSGEFSITHQALAPLSDGNQKMIVSTDRVSSADELLRHKTTARTRYDSALQDAISRGYFDALFLNERGEVAEGARTNIFVDTGTGPMLTPPLTAGALDGVLRRELLEAGKAIEQTLSLTDLQKAKTLYAGNALRGLVRIELENNTA